MGEKSVPVSSAPSARGECLRVRGRQNFSEFVSSSRGGMTSLLVQCSKTQPSSAARKMSVVTQCAASFCVMSANVIESI